MVSQACIENCQALPTAPRISSSCLHCATAAVITSEAAALTCPHVSTACGDRPAMHTSILSAIAAVFTCSHDAGAAIPHPAGSILGTRAKTMSPDDTNCSSRCCGFGYGCGYGSRWCWPTSAERVGNRGGHMCCIELLPRLGCEAPLRFPVGPIRVVLPRHLLQV